MKKIIYTKTDEAPALATYSFLPIVQAYCAAAGVEVETSDISLAGRILARFPEYLGDKAVPDALAELGKLVQLPEANVIKLPNISASIPQMKAAIAELQARGFAIPDYPDDPADDTQRDIRARYDKIKGSAVNPVLREGNSDRRAPISVKNYAKANPHSMGEWSPASKSRVTSMQKGDFYGTEQSYTSTDGDVVNVVLEGEEGVNTELISGLKLLPGEVLDSAVMSKSELEAFLKQAVKEASAEGVLFSIHLKATMMKVSDPIIFGHAVKAYFSEVFAKFGKVLDAARASANNGLGDVIARLESLDAATRADIMREIAQAYADGPALAMVNSDKGITNLHVPSDVIIDASMPAAIRTSGQMWNSSGELQDMLAVIPDRSYAGVYQTVIEDCKKHGAFNPATMGSVPNVGLMAKKAEEYGSHDKTFEIPRAGTVRITTATGEIMSHKVGKGDIFRMCQVKDDAVQDWIELAIRRAKATGTPAVFWLDKNRAHDAQLILKVEAGLKNHDTAGLDLRILEPSAATAFSLERIRRGEDTISVTGNVLRDYLTDLFPIMELGTSAKMLSIVPLMNGGGLFETGAGGSAPKHVQQFVEEGHLRWDSLGEFLALSESLKYCADDVPAAAVLAGALDRAIETLLLENRSPRRKKGELDNRGSHVYLASFWAKEVASQSEDPSLAARFAEVSGKLSSSLEAIIAELAAVEGTAVEIGGYYMPDDAMAAAAMRPSKAFNDIIASV